MIQGRLDPFHAWRKIPMERFQTEKSMTRVTTDGKDLDPDPSRVLSEIFQDVLTCDDLVDVIDEEVEKFVGILLHEIVELN